jgi:hypothetical protein
MSQAQTSKARSSPKFSADGWAIAAALGLALLVRFGLIQRVPW